MKNIMLSKLKIGESGIVVSINGDVHIKRRLLELGFTKGTKVKVLNISPLKSSFMLQVRGYTLALRNTSTNLILVDNFDGK